MHPIIDRCWRAFGPRLTPLSRGDAMSPAALERALVERLAAHLAPDRAPAHVKLPEDFCAHLRAAGDTLWLGQRLALDLLVYPARSVDANLAHALTQYADDDCPGPRGAGVWIEFAHAGDHTGWFLCVDPTREEYGFVGRGDDAHPWLNGADWMHPLQPFEAWCVSLARRRGDPRDPVLLALAPDEAAALPDAPDEALRAVRALVDARTPDPAWSRTHTHPDRTLVLRAAAPLVRTLLDGPARSLRDDAVLRARVLDPDAVRALAQSPIAAVPPWSALVWTPSRHALRAVEDAASAVADFARRSADAGLAWLIAHEEGGDPLLDALDD